MIFSETRVCLMAQLQNLSCFYHDNTKKSSAQKENEKTQQRITFAESRLRFPWFARTFASKFSSRWQQHVTWLARVGSGGRWSVWWSDRLRRYDWSVASIGRLWRTAASCVHRRNSKSQWDRIEEKFIVTMRSVRFQECWKQANKYCVRKVWCPTSSLMKKITVNSRTKSC